MAKSGTSKPSTPQAKPKSKGKMGNAGGASNTGISHAQPQGKTGVASTTPKKPVNKLKSNNNLGAVENNRADLSELGQTSETRPTRRRRQKHCQCS